jgi:tight adherence protein B
VTVMVVGLLGAACGVGLLLVGSAWTPAPPTRRRLAPTDLRVLMIRVAATLTTSMVVLVATGWIAFAVFGGAAGWLAAGAWLNRGAGGRHEQERIEALAAWCEQLRDLLAADHGILGTVQATVATCPAALRPEVSRLAARLARQKPATAIRQFAAEVNDPSGDLVASVLEMAMARSGRTAELLSELAVTIRDRASMRLRIAAERAGNRSEARFVVGFSLAVMVGITVFGRGSSFLDAYDTAAGQLVLALVASLFALGMVWLSRLTRFERPERFLSVGERT